MRYILIVSSFVLCAINLHVTECLHQNIDSTSKVSILSRQVRREVNDSTSFNEYNIISRQKRSLWSSIIDHISAAAEKLHPELALAGGVNDVEGFNKNFRSKLSERSKSANAMLSVGSLENSILTKDDKEAMLWSLETPNAYGKIDADYVKKKSKTKKPNKKLRKIKTAIESFDEKIMKTIVTELRKKSRNITKAENFKLRNILERSSESHNELIDDERYLLDYIGDLDVKAITIEDYGNLYANGINSAISEPIIHKILSRHPSGTRTAITGLKRLRLKRMKLLKQDLSIRQLIDDYGGVTSEYNFNVDDALFPLRIKFIRDSMVNVKWLEYKTDLTSIKKL